MLTDGRTDEWTDGQTDIDEPFYKVIGDDLIMGFGILSNISIYYISSVILVFDCIP